MKQPDFKCRLPVILAAVVSILAGGCWWVSELTGKKYQPLDPNQGTPHTAVFRQGEWIIARASLHNHTILSDGRNRPEDLVELARREGVAVLSIADHREGGIKFSNGLKIPLNGIETIGYEAYFKQLEELKARTKDPVLMIGVEANPYFRNIGKFPNIIIINQNNHLVVYGINNPKVFDEMPAWRTMTLKPKEYLGDVPFQNWVDYMVDHNGMVFVAHAGSGQVKYVLSMLYYQDPPVRNLRLKNLTGYSSLTESYGPEATGPGGTWDSVLVEYLAGMRDRPLWAEADCDFHGDRGYSLTTCGNTLFYLRDLSEDEVYRAMAEGRMTAIAGDVFQNTYVAEFSASENGRPENTIMFGREITVSSPPTIRFRLDHELPGVKTMLIKNGRVVEEVEGSSLEYIDREMIAKKTPAFYRIEVRGPDQTVAGGPSWQHKRVNVLLTNPVFVRLR